MEIGAEGVPKETVNVPKMVEADQIKGAAGLYARTVTRNVMVLQQGDDFSFAESVESTLREHQIMRDCQFSVAATRLGGLVGNRHTSDEKDLSTSLPSSVFEGDFLSRTARGEGNCLEYALTLKLLAETWTNNKGKVHIVEFKQLATNKNLNSHFAVVFEGDIANWTQESPIPKEEQGEAIQIWRNYSRKNPGIEPAGHYVILFGGTIIDIEKLLSTNPK